MAGVTRFEDLFAWQRARSLSSAVYEMTRDGSAGRDFRYVGQIRAAAVSVMSNVAEGFERESGPQFIQFLQIARASAGEVWSLLYVALDLGYVTEASFARLHAQCLDVTRLVTALRNSISRRLSEPSHPRSAIREAPVSYEADGDDADTVPDWLLSGQDHLAQHAW